MRVLFAAWLSLVLVILSATPSAAARITKGTVSRPGSNEPGEIIEDIGLSFTTPVSDVVVLVSVLFNQFSGPVSIDCILPCIGITEILPATDPNVPNTAATIPIEEPASAGAITTDCYWDGDQGQLGLDRSEWYCFVSGLTPGSTYEVFVYVQYALGLGTEVTFDILEDYCPAATSASEPNGKAGHGDRR